MRKTYSKKEIKKFLEKHPYAKEFMNKKSQVVEEDDKLFVEGDVCFRKYEDEWIPSLELLRKKKILPAVTVDKGTPPYIAKGADLMRPGIVSCEEFEEGALVVIIDETHHYPLATGKALYSSKEIMEKHEGKMVKIIHNLRTE